ncbi:MAG: LytR family transcriptional regulator [Cyanobacteria bacterium M_surface_10_m2_119]|nr:LytR family transcriptional regulator [Cyanobacteria bacterium M_surface_10_m2_119]
MSQAQPLPPRGSTRRTARGRRTRPATQAVAAASTGESAGRVARPRPSSSGRRRPPLLAFALGLGLGYGLAGPLPGLVSHAVAALQKGQDQLTAMVNPLGGLARQQVLVMGVDRVGDNTDVMFTVAVKDGRTSLLQVPRDTFVETERYGVLKANALYAYGGIDHAKRELAHLLDAPVQRHLRVNLRAVERIADALGGVEVEVPKRMYYIDNAQGLYIDLYPGRQVLRGEALEGFLRYRNDEMGDLGRMERQKLVLHAVFAKLIQPGTLTRLPELLQIAGEDIDTDLNPLEMGQLLTAMATTELNTSQLPGRLFWHNDLSYWMPSSNTHYPAGTGEGELEAPLEGQTQASREGGDSQGLY